MGTYKETLKVTLASGEVVEMERMGFAVEYYMGGKWRVDSVYGLMERDKAIARMNEIDYRDVRVQQYF
jgi:hypothetical protein